ncbi:MAG: PEP-CTERM sorting domain-containing protein [Planctomycetales bacterium]|nr:PEP-CTERM sorting domain-containing protein [Planctomycetales bacterium]
MSLQSVLIECRRTLTTAGGLAVVMATLVCSTTHGAITHQYTFNNGTADDAVGAANGTLVNGTTVTLDGQADLDGVNDYIDLPGATIAINTYTAVTLEAWFTMDAAPGWQRLFDFGDTNASNLGRNYIFYSPSSGPGDQRAVISDADPGYNSEEVALSAPALATATDHHVAVTITNGGNMVLYHNGVQVATTPLTKSLATVSNNFALLGESTYTGDPNFNGRIDEFRIYDTALSASEVQASFDAGQVFKSTLVADVNTLTGNISLRNATASPITFDQYQITSAGGSLDSVSWSSLSDQNYDSAGAGQGQSWDEAGGVSANALAELFLRGSTTLDPNESVSLGAAFNIAGAQDLRLQFSTPDGTIAKSAVNYVTGATDADFNGDNIVNGADFLAWQRNYPLASGATNAQGDANGDGDVDADDLGDWQSRFGFASAAPVAGSVPEPSALALAAGALAALVAARRRPIR